MCSHFLSMFKIAIALKHLLIPRDHMISRWQNVKGGSTVIEQPTPDQGARCVWSDSQGQIWVSEGMWENSECIALKMIGGKNGDYLG